MEKGANKQHQHERNGQWTSPGSDIDFDVMEFGNAMQALQRRKGRPLRWSEVLEEARKLGWIKVELPK